MISRVRLMTARLEAGEIAMKSKIGVMVAVLFALTGWVPNASAQESDDSSDRLEELRELSPDARREALEAMSAEERAALRESAQGRREQRRADRESMTPEEREAAQQGRRERFESMTPEQQEAMRERRAGRQQSGDRSSRRGRGSSQQGQSRRGSRPGGT